MQYFKPEGHRFVGDCMPFFHAGVLHLYYLLDEGHHQGGGGLGGHQWAHASTRDLLTWTHHPLALAVEEPWESSICTGSVFWHDGVFHAFYATRKPDWTQHLSHAAGPDGARFVKTRPLPLLPVPPGYDPQHFRDPFVFRDEDGRFQMLVTARQADGPLPGRGGCLLRLSSEDLSHWSVEGPLLSPGGRDGGATIPECPDCFTWNGWCYLVFGSGLATHYRMARHWRGPWLRPPQPLPDSRLLAVMKTAPFGTDRRLGAAWIGTRADDRDAGAPQWGGNLVLRELVQHPDGTLSTRFPPELYPFDGPGLDAVLHALTPGVHGDGHALALEAPDREAVGAFLEMPHNFQLRCRVRPQGDNARFGLGLRGAGGFESHYALVFDPGAQSVTLEDQSCAGVREIAQPFDLAVVCHGDLIDVCIDNARCLINRLPERRGDRLFWFCEAGTVAFEQIRVTS
jgi:beta-fructofuranosidase